MDKMQPIEYTYGEYCRRWIYLECILMVIIIVVMVILPVYALCIDPHYIWAFITFFGVCLGVFGIRKMVCGCKKMLAAYPETTAVFKVDERGIYVHKIMLEILYWWYYHSSKLVQPRNYLPMITGKSITGSCCIPWGAINHIQYHNFIFTKQDLLIYTGPFLRICEKKNSRGLVIDLFGISVLSRLNLRNLRKTIRYFSGDNDIFSYKTIYRN